MNATPILLKDVHKNFKSRRLFENLNLVFEPGLHLLSGQNGIGKSTLIRLISGIEKPQKGEVRICGYSVDRDRLEANKKRVYVPDLPSFFDHVKVQEMLDVLWEVRGIRSAEEKFSIISTWGLEPLMNHEWRALSLGQRKRSFLAALLVSSVPVWVLDEPTNGLDENWKEFVLQKLAAHAKSGGTVLFSTHDCEAARNFGPVETALLRSNEKTEFARV